MANPIPHVVSVSGTVEAAPAGSIPIALYGADSAGGAVAWADVTGKPAVIAAGADAAAARLAVGAAPTAAPTFTGIPAAPTAAVATNSTQLATTAFVNAATRGKTATVALAAVSAANGSPAAADPVTKAEFDVLVTLANANKAAINAIIAALKA